MSFHSFVEYIRYRWKAKSRHGIHSPLVYAFIDCCLMRKDNEGLLLRIKRYFSANEVVVLDIKEADRCRNAVTIAGAETVLVIENIHANKAATEYWKILKKEAPVKLSIDLYSVGLLLFSADVKEPQHFILKYPL